jgi:hypothetical protein
MVVQLPFSDWNLNTYVTLRCEIWGFHGGEDTCQGVESDTILKIVSYNILLIKTRNGSERIVLLDFIHRLVSQKIEE